MISFQLPHSATQPDYRPSLDEQGPERCRRMKKDGYSTPPSREQQAGWRMSLLNRKESSFVLTKCTGMIPLTYRYDCFSGLGRVGSYKWDRDDRFSDECEGKTKGIEHDSSHISPSVQIICIKNCIELAIRQHNLTERSSTKSRHHARNL